MGCGILRNRFEAQSSGDEEVAGAVATGGLPNCRISDVVRVSENETVSVSPEGDTEVCDATSG